MKPQHLSILIATSAVILSSSCKDSTSNTTSSAGGTGGEQLALDYPPAVSLGTEKTPAIPNLVQPPAQPPIFRIPTGTVLLSKDKTTTSSDDCPFIGELSQVTDGDKQGDAGYAVELAEGKQWVQIDLEKSAAINAVCVWHFHSELRVYHDVIIQVSDDKDFNTGVTTIYNNDYDNSAGIGKGTNNPYVESRFGLIAEGKGAKGRYVRLYSAGNTANDSNHYTEVEIYGIAQ